MLQAIHGVSFQIVRRGVDFAIARQRSNLEIFAVLAGTAVQTGLANIEIAQGCADVTQGKAVHGRRAQCIGHRSIRKCEISDGQFSIV